MIDDRHPTRNILTNKKSVTTEKQDQKPPRSRLNHTHETSPNEVKWSRKKIRIKTWATKLTISARCGHLAGTDVPSALVECLQRPPLVQLLLADLLLTQPHLGHHRIHCCHLVRHRGYVVVHCSYAGADPGELVEA